MDRESSPSPVNHACASCKHQRKKCDSNCELAPYFPGSKYNEFQNAHKLFGVSNIVKIMSWIEPHQRQAAADSILIEGNAWKNDPVHGCYGVIKDLAAQVAFQEKQLSVVNQHLAFHKQQQKIKLEQDQSDYFSDLPDLVRSSIIHLFFLSSQFLDKSIFLHEILTLDPASSLLGFILFGFVWITI